MTTAELIDYVPVSFKQERDKAERMLKNIKGISENKRYTVLTRKHG